MIESFDKLRVSSSPSSTTESECFATCASELTKEVIFNNNLSKIESENEKLRKFQIIHFNDVYDIEGNAKEAIGGAARFATALKYLSETSVSVESGNTLVLFSGDAFSPSTRNRPLNFDLINFYLNIYLFLFISQFNNQR